MKKSILKSVLFSFLFLPTLHSMAQCPAIICPANITTNSDPGVCSATVTYTLPVGTDPCALTTQTFNYTGTIDTWIVPAGVTAVTIEAKGAQGGTNVSSGVSSGLGADMKGDFTVVPGSTLRILVGQQPNAGGGNGGGGGTFVTDISNNPLVVAGGGGGSASTTDSPDKNGQITTTGGTGAAGGGAGGTAGSGGGIGASGFQSGAGGGLLTNGTDGWTTSTGGSAFVNGGAGGPTNAPANGGFGGGGSGSSYVVGGGGGGYSGGGSGGNSSAGVGGGGGSYNGGANQANASGTNTGNGTVIITYSGGSVSTAMIAGLASGSSFPMGTTTVTYEVTGGGGTTSNCSFTVTVNDNQAPVPDVASLPTAAGECSVTATAPTATDNCTGIITATTTDPTSFTVQGTYSINWTYDDGNGNTATQVQNVTVADITAPVPDVASLPSASGECSVSLTAPTATDNCAGILTATTSDPVNYSVQGSYIVNWTYSDGNGNTTTQVQNVTVDDVTNPVPDAVSLSDATGICLATAVAPTATDNCAGAITATTTDPVSYTTAGTYSILWTYDDGNGNTATQTQNVIVSGVDTSYTVAGITLTANLAGQTYAWLDCGSNMLIAGETNQSYNVTANGNYALVINEAGCTDTSSCYNFTTTGMAGNNSVDAISIYPNPSHGEITIELGTISTATIKVVDMLGRDVILKKTQESKTIIDLSSFDDGVFFISVETPSTRKVSRVIKN